MDINYNFLTKSLFYEALSDYYENHSGLDVKKLYLIQYLKAQSSSVNILSQCRATILKFFSFCYSFVKETFLSP